MRATPVELVRSLAFEFCPRIQRHTLTSMDSSHLLRCRYFRNQTPFFITRMPLLPVICSGGRRVLSLVRCQYHQRSAEMHSTNKTTSKIQKESVAAVGITEFVNAWTG